MQIKDRLIPVPSSNDSTPNTEIPSKRLVLMPDGTFAEVVVALNSSGNDISGADRELLATRYTCKQSFTGAAVGDVIRQTVALDVSGSTMSVISVLWENESTGVTIGAPQSVPAYLEAIKQSDALTLSQLLSTGPSTAANQVTQIGYLADLADANDRHATYKLVKSEDLGAGTKYILKSNGIGWLMIRKTYTDTASTLAYAGPANNSGVTLAQSWGQRTSLIYSETVGGA